MKVFSLLKKARMFQRNELHLIMTMEDADIVLEIGYHQEMRTPLAIKQLTLLGIRSSATVYRRLKRLRNLGVIKEVRSHDDGRALILGVAPHVRKAYCKYVDILRKT